MTLTIVGIVSAVGVMRAETFRTDVARNHSKNYRKHFGTGVEWRFDALPSDGTLDKDRLPYSGYIYPDKQGGTGVVLRKYDRAFHRGMNLAAKHEVFDIESTRERRGLFFAGRRVTPDWAGHCNGWTAAAIRHAEPQKSVRRGSVVFTPADIKALLAEVYTYNRTEFLGGMDKAINPGLMHILVTNWIGRQKHPIAMDSTVGKEIWNYPIYAYKYDAVPRGSRAMEVKMNLAFASDLEREENKASRNYRYLSFHYDLHLNSKKQIVGGRYHSDSEKIDMMWVPLSPVEPGKPGNEAGNPHVKVHEVLAMWRESVPASYRESWLNIDPAEGEAGVGTELPTAEELESPEFADVAESGERASEPQRVNPPIYIQPVDSATSPAAEQGRDAAPADEEAQEKDAEGDRFQDSLPVETDLSRRGVLEIRMVRTQLRTRTNSRQLTGRVTTVTGPSSLRVVPADDPVDVPVESTETDR